MEVILIKPGGRCTKCKTGLALNLHEDGRHLCVACEREEG